MRRQRQDEIRQYIKSDEVNKSILHERQAWHDRDSGHYKKGRSYLLPGVDAQELVDRYHGTGHAPITAKGWNGKEVVIADTDIGVDIDPSTNKETITNRFVIHYRRTGTHVVPTNRSE